MPFEAIVAWAFDSSHHAFVPAVSVPIALSLCVPVVVVQNDTLLVNTAAVAVELSPNLKLPFGVVESEIVGQADRARVAVPGEAVLAVFEGDRAGDDVGDGDVVAAELEAVAIAVVVRGAVGRECRCA